MNTTPPQPRVLVSWTIAPSSGQTVDGSNRRCSGPLQTATGQEEGGGRGFDQAVEKTRARLQGEPLTLQVTSLAQPSSCPGQASRGQAWRAALSLTTAFGDSAGTPSWQLVETAGAGPTLGPPLV